MLALLGKQQELSNGFGSQDLRSPQISRVTPICRVRPCLGSTRMPDVKRTRISHGIKNADERTGQLAQESHGEALVSKTNGLGSIPS